MVTKSNKPTRVKAETPEKQTRSQMLATLALHPAARSASILGKIDSNSTIDFFDLTREVRKRAEEIRTEDMNAASEMLAAQSIALDGLFANLARRAGCNMEEGYGEAAERYMKLALRAQAQCAKTIQIMSELKNPRHIAFVQQANIAHNQLVNNGQSLRAENFEIQPNKLIDGDADDLQMDIRTTPTTGGADPAVEAVGTINRADNSRR